MKVLIIDDEEHARKKLRGLVEKSNYDLKLLGEAANVKDGVFAIKKWNPELIFLDVDMPDGTGFELLKIIDDENLKVIFTTAYTQYAIKAFKFSALDYLLKPIDEQEFSTAIAKAIKSESNNQSFALRCDAFLLNSNAATTKHIVVSDRNNYHMVAVGDILRAEADGNYTRIYLNNNSCFLDAKNLKEYEVLLREFNFVRIHKSHLVNAYFIASLEKSRTGKLIMKDKTVLPVASIKRPVVLEAMKSL